MNRQNLFFFLLALVFFVLRILAGRLTGALFLPEGYHDDALMIRYADFYDHFIAQTLPYYDLLVKDMGFPLFLNFLKATGISYPDAISLIWLFSAVTFTALFSSLTKIQRKEILLLIYVFVLFMPISFSHIGLRLYRNSALAPFYFFVITLMVYLFVIHWCKLKLSLKNLFVFNGVLGIFFSWTYYMKEDGIWLLMCLIAVIIACLIHIIFIEVKTAQEKIFHTLILFLPLIIFFSCTTAYKFVNNYFFGVYETNNRTNGELGKFVSNVYKIKSAERNGKVWAATDAILKTFDVSETLKENVALKNSVINTNWVRQGGTGNIFETPIRGDFLGWVMLNALSDSKTCSSLVEQEIYLKKVNEELEKAFASGTLEKEDKIFLTSSMGGLNWSEIFQLRSNIATIYQSQVAMYYYDAVKIPAEKILFVPQNKIETDIDEKVLEYEEIIKKAGEFTNVDFFAKNEHAEAANTFTAIIFSVYRVINCIMFTAAFIGIFLAIKKLLQTKIEKSFNVALIVVISVSCLILSAVYSLAISWFCQFLEYDSMIYSLSFYSIGLIPMLIIFEIFGTYLFCRMMKKDT